MYKVQFKEEMPYGRFIFCETFEQAKTGYEFLIRYTFKNVLYENTYNIPSIRKDPQKHVINGKSHELQNQKYSLCQSSNPRRSLFFYGDKSDYCRLTKLESLKYQEYPGSNIICITEVSDYNYNEYKFKDEYIQEFENLKRTIELEILELNKALELEISNLEALQGNSNV